MAGKCPTREEIIEQYETRGVRKKCLDALLRIVENEDAKDRDVISACRELLWPYVTALQANTLEDTLKKFLADTKLDFKGGEQSES